MQTAETEVPAPALARFSCGFCGAALVLQPGLRTATCPYCGSPSVLERSTDDAPEPMFVLGFQLPGEAAVAQMQRWLRGRTVFARAGVRKARVEEVRGVYVPAWLYGAVARADYSAEIGEDWWETRTVGRGKKRHTEVRHHIEWRSLSGTWAGYVPDLLISASTALPDAELSTVGGFDHALFARYRPADVAGWIAEDPSRERDACLADARTQARAGIGQRLSSFLPGDHQRDLRFGVALDEESLDLVLLPVWIFALRYAPDRPPMRVLVNGQTGRAAGRVPLSWIKILSTVAVAVALVLLFVWSQGAFAG